MSINSLIYERNQYVKARTAVLTTANYVNNSIQKLKNALEVETNGYSVDGLCTDNNLLSSIHSTEANLYATITGSVVPRINQAINDLNRRIEIAIAEDREKGEE